VMSRLRCELEGLPDKALPSALSLWERERIGAVSNPFILH